MHQFFKDCASAQRLRMCLLGPHLDTFAARVSRLGYARSTIQTQLTLLGDLSWWLTQHALGVRALGTDVINRFLSSRWCRKTRGRSDVPTFRLFLDHLRAEGVLRPAPSPVDRSPLGQLRIQYQKYLRKERGLSPVTGCRYWLILRRLLGERFGDGRIRLKDLRPADVTRFLLQQPRCRTPKGAQLRGTALRSFLRFLFRKGKIDRDLSAAIPAVRSWRLVEVPKYLKPAEVQRLLTFCDRTSSVGRRDYAVLLLLARFGLRAGEVVGLELGDLDWRAGEVTVRGKGSVHDRLPLPPDVGKTLAAYLRSDRPPCATRRVFVRMRAPHRGFKGSSTVCTIVRRALQRAGLTPPIMGAHLLRHSLATSLLRHGASLPEIGELLRHRSPNTTEIYAKVDLDALRVLVRPWPMIGGAQ